MQNAKTMLENFEENYQLGDSQMDSTHQEFLSACDLAAGAKGEEFGPAFERLLKHTEEHFDSEEQRMLAIGHTSYAEHRADHQRILGDMSRFNERVQAGRGMMAKAWLKDSLLAWFDIHAKTMDSALAADIKAKA